MFNYIKDLRRVEVNILKNILIQFRQKYVLYANKVINSENSTNFFLIYHMSLCC